MIRQNRSNIFLLVAACLSLLALTLPGLVAQGGETVVGTEYGEPI